MEYYIISLFSFTFFIILIISKFFKKSKLLPPGPTPWPIIGNIHQLGDKPHWTVADLSKTYGPIMSLKLGTTTTIVVSSPEIAKEMFLKHDLAISSRAVPNVVRAEDYDKYSMIWLPACPKWKKLRKFAITQLLTNQRLNASQVLRQNKVNELVEYVRQCCKIGAPIDIGKVAFITSLNLLSNTIFSMDLASYDSSKSQEFKDLVTDLMKEAGKPNITDFFPLLRGLDLQGAMKRFRDLTNKIMSILEEVIDERLKDSKDLKDDVLGTLLKLFKDEELSMKDVKHMLADLFVAGTDTTTTTLEWAMTELLRNPQVMRKAQIELEQVLGKDGLMQESNIIQLPYIQSIVKETLRLHPPGPFLAPHKSEQDFQLWGYLVPKNATIWVNVWAIGRDPSVWPNPELFLPERYLETKVDVKGQDFELIPFGSGRRICPGIPLAHRMLHLMLATLLHLFNWKSVDDTSSIHVEEIFGISVQRSEPLEAIPLLR